MKRVQITSLDGQARLALARMTTELRSMRDKDAPGFSAGSNSITFSTAFGETVTYKLLNGSLMRNSQPLAKHVTALSFVYYKSDGDETNIPSEIRYIKFSFTMANNNASLSIASTVFPRNYS